MLYVDDLPHSRCLRAVMSQTRMFFNGLELRWPLPSGIAGWSTGCVARKCDDRSISARRVRRTRKAAVRVFGPLPHASCNTPCRNTSPRGLGSMQRTVLVGWKCQVAVGRQFLAPDGRRLGVGRVLAAKFASATPCAAPGRCRRVAGARCRDHWSGQLAEYPP